MIDSLHAYFFTFLHPFKVQKGLRLMRSANIPQQTGLSPTNTGISFAESLSISWAMAIIKAIYSSIAVILGMQIFFYSNVINQLPVHIEKNQAHVLFYIVLKVVLFPLCFWIHARIWFNSIKLFTRLAGITEDDLDVIINQIVNNALTSHTFLLIPIMGDTIFYISTLVYLYAGLRNNLCFSILQCFAIILIPLLAILLLVVLLVSSFALIATSLFF